MQAFHLTGSSIDALSAVELPDPQPGRGEVLVRMRAASLNFLDVAVATGLFPPPSFPLVPVADGAGDVVALGPDVDTLRLGDRVMVHPKGLWPSGRVSARRADAMRGVSLPGALRELAAISADTLVKVPEHLSFEEAATLPVAATTAWNALAFGGVGPGDTVVLIGTGGVSIVALQLAKARGARVLITSSSERKLERAMSLGADHGINYKEKAAWDEAVLDLTGGRGADLVLETAGSATFNRSIAATRIGGGIYSIGFLSGGRVEIDLLQVINKALRIQGSNTGSAQDLADASAAIAAHEIKPVLDKTYSLLDVAEAYRAVEGGGHFGKLTLKLDWEAGR